jgi:hypothetical protein
MCIETRKYSYLIVNACIITNMTYVSANSCRASRHSEGLESLLTSRGHVMADTWRGHSFDQVAIDPTEVSSTR